MSRTELPREPEFSAGAATVPGVALPVPRPAADDFPAFDAAVLDTWAALIRALAAGGAALAVAGLGWLISPQGLGLGDVKLLGLIGLVLGWLGWGVLVAGVFLGLVAGSVVSLVLVAARRTRWRTALPFGPPLLLGAVLAVGIAAVGSGP